MIDGEAPTGSVDDLWRDLVTAALLGSDRRDPPVADGPIGALVADAVRSDPSARTLATVAACVAVRRAGVRPGPDGSTLQRPAADDRPACTPAAAERWHHVTTAWPVLEDEWMLACIENGWRVAPELVPPMLRRHRRNAVRRARVVIAAGPIAEWLADLEPDLRPVGTAGTLTPAEAEQLGELPELPMPSDLADLLDATGAEIGGRLGVGIEDGTYAEPHRAVLINLVARCVPGALVDLGEVIDAVDRRGPGRALALTLGDLAATRARMLDELSSRG